MCGRYTLARAEDGGFATVLQTELAYGDALPPRYNIAPTDPIRIAITRHPHGEPDADPVRQLRTARWGLVPSWSKGPGTGPSMINARRETVTEKPSFRKASSTRRCAIPADGYYEWQARQKSPKQPFWLHDGDDLLTFAGLYEWWADPTKPEDDDDRWLLSATIITTSASDSLGHIHDRTPLVLPPAMWGDWLDPGLTDPADVRHMIDSVPEPHLTPRPVSTLVNKVSNDGPQLVEEHVLD